MRVIKHSGKAEVFQPDKLKRSIYKAFCSDVEEAAANLIYDFVITRFNSANVIYSDDIRSAVEEAMDRYGAMRELQRYVSTR